MSADQTFSTPLIRSGIVVPVLWGAAALSAAALTAIGPLSLPLGLGAITTCLGIALGTLATRQRRGERTADVHRIALAIGRDGVWDYDLRAGSVEYDDRCARMLGYERGHVADRLSAWGKLVHPEDLGRARAALDDYLEGSADSYDICVRLRDVRGCWRWIIDRGQVVERGEDGKPLRMIGIHREIESSPERVGASGSDASTSAFAPTTLDDETPKLGVPNLQLAATELPNDGPVEQDRVVDSPLEVPERDPEAVVRAALALLLADLDFAERETRPCPEWQSAAALRRRLERLESWHAPQMELVPLAAAVDDFAAPNIDVALDLPIAEADPTILLEVLALVIAEATGAPSGRRRVTVETVNTGENRAAIAVVALKSGVDLGSSRLATAADLAALTAGEVRVKGRRIEVDLRCPRH